MTNTRATDPEVLETRFPSGWSAWRIAEGPAAKVHGPAAKACTASCASSNPSPSRRSALTATVPVPGREGGHPGAIGKNRILRADGRTEPMAGNARAELSAGDAIDMLTPGGGGWGKPT
jgi:5-oxoprolinase (ATP-hydrolysing)